MAFALSQRACAQQAALDGFFAMLLGDPLAGRVVSDRAFAPGPLSAAHAPARR